MKVLHLLKAPDFVSMVNLLFGMMAIFLAFSGAYGAAAACLLVAAAADGMDGYVARKTSSGPLGPHIDSLIDAVSFGVAPAVIIYCMSESIISTVFVFVYVACGILRLARYNAFPPEKPEYSGIPITGAAVAIALAIILNFNVEKTGLTNAYTMEMLVIFMFVLSLLMISTIPYSKVMKKRTFVLLIVLFLGTIASVFVETPYVLIFPLILSILMLMYLVSPIIGLIGKKKSVEL
ncbi:CDP-diacylglycerol--serine O-phosphatidyltransferase [Methanimicrococcus blatticola]|uniref:CDP-diacylglycerol--serine O-phosphatidyltransferase n=1 Tax=Methanimicrococcus blatticola TaxID=91560 RepID=A0A484F3M5_9EURY|nr:CDP-diacylglycerol--serine O-phosphatidyltransferase [Methanimicrococcus blatticola]MBZ3935704.1 CDP-diacylglycerol--serine O-phosphatidyltransferase [Methanimicrococcus blatticola]MCC2508175.1 CDP-diacylglycerol--serine O-phosphatidyltransferase [Methanimicrococcus blatticola]TDQ68748.1 archaetidylserine synthase [Methanimicrococcus blatticola]